MTFPSDDQGERPGGPWSQQPPYPPSYRRGGYPHQLDQPGYDDPDDGEPGYPPPRDPGYPPSGYRETGPRAYPGAGYPHYPEAGEHGYQETEEPGYVQADPRDYRPPYEIPEVAETPGARETTSAARPRRTAWPHSLTAGRGSTTAGPGNPHAFTGLVLGALGLLASFLAPILAIVFGVTGLTRIRRTGQRGGAMAVTGILLGVMWIAATALFAGLVIHNQGYGSVAALRAGSCFDNAQPGHVAVRVRYLSSCAQPHNGEVVGTFALPGTAWPGQQTVSRAAATGCAELLTSVLGQQTLSSGVRGMNYSPDQQAWSTGTRAVSCVLLDPNATHTGSMIGGN